MRHVKSAADPGEAKAEPVNHRDWDDPQPHGEQSVIGGRGGPIATEVKNPRKGKDHNRPKYRGQ